MIYEKTNLNSDGQQFHQYQKNKQPSLPLIIEHKKSPWHMPMEIQVLAWDRHRDLLPSAKFALLNVFFTLNVLATKNLVGNTLIVTNSFSRANLVAGNKSLWDRHKDLAELNRLMESQLSIFSPTDYWISNTDKNKR